MDRVFPISASRKSLCISFGVQIILFARADRLTERRADPASFLRDRMERIENVAQGNG
jgi:hypothetical protein